MAWLLGTALSGRWGVSLRSFTLLDHRLGNSTFFGIFVYAVSRYGLCSPIIQKIACLILRSMYGLSVRFLLARRVGIVIVFFFIGVDQGGTHQGDSCNFYSFPYDRSVDRFEVDVLRIAVD